MLQTSHPQGQTDLNRSKRNFIKTDGLIQRHPTLDGGCPCLESAFWCATVGQVWDLPESVVTSICTVLKHPTASVKMSHGDFSYDFFYIHCADWLALEFFGVCFLNVWLKWAAVYSRSLHSKHSLWTSQCYQECKDDPAQKNWVSKQLASFGLHFAIVGCCKDSLVLTVGDLPNKDLTSWSWHHLFHFFWPFQPRNDLFQRRHACH